MTRTIILIVIISLFAGAVLSNDNDVVQTTRLGEECMEKGDRDKAVRYFNKAVSINPQYPIPYFYLGKLNYSMNKPDEAAAQFDKYIERMRPLAVNDASREAYLEDLHDISQIYFGLKRRGEILKVLNEILGIAPADQTAIYNMGIYNYIYEHDRPKGYKYFLKAIEIDPASYIAGKARYAIEYMRSNPDSRIEPDFSFIDKEYKD